MEVCQTCGVKGYESLLIHCVHCEFAAIHRYCVDGPIRIDDEDCIWSCEDCVSKVVEHVPPSRKSKRICSIVEREASRKKARRKWKTTLSNQIKKSDEQITLKDEMDNFIFQNKSDSKQNDCSISKQIMDLSCDMTLDAKNSLKGKRSSASNLHKKKDLHTLATNGEDERVRLSTFEPYSRNSKEETLEVVIGQQRDASMKQLESIPSSTIHPKRKDCDDKNKVAIIGEVSIDSRMVKDISTPIKRRRFIVEEDSDEENDSILIKKTSSFHKMNDISSSNSSEVSNGVLEDQVKPNGHIPFQSLPTKYDNIVSRPYVQVQPVVDAIWRGQCSIDYSTFRLSIGLEAHLSNVVDPRAHGAASALPKVIPFETTPRQGAWPKAFQISPPTSDAIGLYFFPADERDEMVYEKVLEGMFENHLVLASTINNLELLVFSSQDLPQEEWRFRRRYYMWGVFKPCKESLLSRSTIKTKKDLYLQANVSVDARKPTFSECRTEVKTKRPQLTSSIFLKRLKPTS